MSFLDRTRDFAEAVESCRSRRLAKQLPVNVPATRTRKRTEFHTVASNVAQELAATYGKLERLTKRKQQRRRCTCTQARATRTSDGRRRRVRRMRRVVGWRFCVIAVFCFFLLSFRCLSHCTVAKSTSMYGDPAQDIQLLSDDIKASMTVLHKQLKELETLRDSQNQQATVHSDTIVKSLGNRLLVAKTNFLGVLETRKEVCLCVCVCECVCVFNCFPL